MLSRHMGNSEEVDFPLYPDSAQNMFMSQQPFVNVPNFDIDSNLYNNFTRTNAPFMSGPGLGSNAIYTDIDPSVSAYALESPELRAGASSNYSTASAPSAASSAMGSPPSIQGHIASVPEWGPSGLGPNPGIVRFDSFSQTGNEYNFPSSGMEEFALEFDPAKPDGFVGECETISRVACSGQPGAASISPKSLSLSNLRSSPAMVDESMHYVPGSMLSPTTPLSARSRGSRDDYLMSPPPVSVSSQSSVSLRRPSQEFRRPSLASSAASRAQDMYSSPRPGVSQPSFISESPSFFFSQSSGSFVLPLDSSCWFPLSIQSRLSAKYKGTLKLTINASDPSILHSQYTTRPSSATQPNEPYQTPTYPESPALSHLSHLSRSPTTAKQGSQSPFLNSHYNGYPYPPPRRRSIQSYSSQENFSGEESREKGRCTYPDCGKVFKDLKAHMLTHQNERPEKCPIQNCDYHIKGFARKYDKNRHTLTHYKGDMVCGFCPGSGSSHEKSFNRADVFKRHLTSVHAVEQSAPNSRKKTASNRRNVPGYASEASGKCSTCSATFSSAQDFYEHLDDCVLRIVQLEEPSEAVNAARLAEVEQNEDVHETLRNNALPTTTMNVYFSEEDAEDNDVDDDNDEDFTLTTKIPRRPRNNHSTNGGIQKSRGLTHSRGGVVSVVAKGRKRNKLQPRSWGCAESQMKMRKRVLCVFDGPRRLWKDDMMIDTSGGETRVTLPDGKSWVTDLDVMTVRRADAFHSATDDEKGPWLADDLTGLDVEKLLEVKSEVKNES